MRWFILDTTDAGAYRLKKHARNDFWQWVCSWSMAIVNPADIGCNSDGYVLPPLSYHNHLIPCSSPGNGKLFSDAAVSATQFAGELRRSMSQRLAKAADIANNTPGQVIVWVRLNDEAEALKNMILDHVEVSGADPNYLKTAKIQAFVRGEYRVLITKQKIAGFGINFQNCHTQVFASLDFSFEGLYQAVRRSYRFGQTQPVAIHLITTDTMENVEQSIQRKTREFETMRDELAKHTVENFREFRKLKTEFIHQVQQGKNWTMHLGDSVELIDQIADESIDLSVFSPPFSNLYTYSDSIRDMGNVSSDEEFQEFFAILVRKLHAKMRPGRIVAAHVKNLARYKTSSGTAGIKDFRGDCIRTFEAAGFVFHSEVTIWTNPVQEMTRTKTQRLLYKQLRGDASYSGTGMAEYLCLFRKYQGIEEGDTVPIDHDFGGDNHIDLDTWQKYASPVWMDIPRTEVLNGQLARDGNDEKHIAPLQLETIKRAVLLWSNPGETVFTPFGGIGSELYQSVLLGRKAIGIELKESYFNQACKFLREAEVKMNQAKLF
jgi:DNA modification methylase